MPVITTDQFGQLLSLLQRIVDRQYTITGAADWNMLIAVLALVGILVGAMWIDLRGKLSENKGDHEKLWAALGDCQDDCCPRGNKSRTKP